MIFLGELLVKKTCVFIVKTKLQVNVRRSLKTRDGLSSESNGNSHMTKSLKPPVVRKGKLVVVDLAGSERINKSGSSSTL